MTTRLGPTTGTWRGGSFAHEAFVFDSTEQLSARCLPFVQEGLELGQPVLVVAGEAMVQVLRDQLGPDIRRLALLSSADTWWAGGHGTLLSYTRGLWDAAEPGTPARVLGEPTWLARRDGQVWHRYEAVVNAVFDSMPLYCVCAYDRGRLGFDRVEEALRTHPMTWDGAAPVPSPRYVDPVTYLRSVEPAWTARPDSAPSQSFASLAAARGFIRAVATVAVGAERAGDMTLAVHELVANAVEAAGVVEVSSWPEDGRLVWEVCDEGPGLHNPTAGYAPPADDLDSGRGLWIARGLADESTVRQHGRGTAIRLYFAT